MAAAGFRAAVLALSCAACTSIDADARTFAGTRWRVTAINGHSTPSGDRYFMSFDGGNFTGRMGCNTVSGGYRISGDRLVPGMTVATQAACYVDTPRAIQPMSFEVWAFSVLRQPMRMRWPSGHRLTLRNGAGSIELELEGR
jgi:heat shock protein HslJ